MDHLVNWLKTFLIELESSGAEDLINGALKKCGQDCACRGNILDLATKTKSEIKDINDLKEVGAAVQRYFGGVITPVENGFIAEFGDGKCVCPMVGQKYIESPLLCNCTKGYNEYLWSRFFDRPVNVEILSSALRAGDACRLRITYDT